MPSKYEGFSQAVMKAIAQGKMVIASNVGGLPFEIGYGKYGRLVPYGNEKILANAITEGLRCESNVDMQGMRQYASQFTFDERTAHLESQYHDLIGSVS
jgi:glycosyltransferase involved in cell wall biosynthesis